MDKKSDNIPTHRNWLLPVLMNGQVRVDEATEQMNPSI